MEYPFGWPVAPNTHVIRERRLSQGRGTVLVSAGDLVEPTDIIARSIETEQTVKAGFRGKILRIILEYGAVIEGTAMVINGLAGFGPSCAGKIQILPQLGVNANTVISPEAIAVFSGSLTADLLRAAVSNRAGGIFAAGAPAELLSEFLQADVTALLDGAQHLFKPPPCTIILAHGFENRPMAKEIYRQLSALSGQTALMNGYSNIFSGARPELIYSEENARQTPLGATDPIVAVQSRVWITQGSYAGSGGIVEAIPVAQRRFPSGIIARAAVIRLDTGEEILEPLSNVQRIG